MALICAYLFKYPMGDSIENKSAQDIQALIDALKKDRLIGMGITAHEYVLPVKAAYEDIPINEKLRAVLKAKGIERLYAHQAEGIRNIREGHNLVVMTPTASGKSLIYNIPVIETIVAESQTRALYIFPLKGLEQDQVQKLNELLDACLPVKDKKRFTRQTMNYAEVYDGDTTPYRRRKIRDEVPNVIFTTPDMVHLSLNQFHKKWEDFFRNLKYVILDEIHTYRGVFGSNVSHVLRRLRRICAYWGSDPQFIACSATISNAKELAETLTGLSFTVVDSTGAPRSGKHFIFLNPMDSAYTEVTRIFLKSVISGFRTILFTKARKITELIYKWSIERAPGLKDKISPYRAGFLPSERREIEQRLFSGELIGVISTSALELGVDIGGLDVCILCGYPGSVSSTWQRAGRVGRQGNESLIIMVAAKDALDQYLVSHPEAFFCKPHEASTCDPGNEKILKKHLLCAAEEIYISRDDAVYMDGKIKGLSGIIDGMVREGNLRLRKAGNAWFSTRGITHRDVGIRSVCRPLRLINGAGKLIGALEGRRVYRDGFPGAVYLHRGMQYLVRSLDLDYGEAICTETDADYYTHALSNEHIEIIGTPERSHASWSREVEIYSSRLMITYHVVGYEKKDIFSGTRLSRHTVEMPEYIFETEGIFMLVHRSLANSIVDKGYDLAGTLHAAEHVTIGSMPLFSLCDKGDIGGLSYPLYPEFKTPAIFIYDGYEGGIGLTRRVLEVSGDWIQSSRELIRNCDCEEGCPSCVQDSQCGSANDPLDKNGAVFFLGSLLE